MCPRVVLMYVLLAMSATYRPPSRYDGPWWSRVNDMAWSPDGRLIATAEGIKMLGLTAMTLSQSCFRAGRR